MEVLQVKNIKKDFGRAKVLKGIDFSLNKSEVLAIIGSSGSGKTTLLRCLNFLEIPTEGVITVNGEEVFNSANENTKSEKEIRENRLHFGLVFQSFNLFPQYTVKKNVTLGSELLNAEMLKKKKASSAERKEVMDKISEKADSLLQQVGLSEKKNYYPCQLSGGQQQRVAIARALAMDPDILCFDEPTSALDPELTGEVLKVIKELKNAKKTMIVVTHEMEFARHVADKILFMADGIIEEMGTPDEIFDNPQSTKLKSFLRSSLEKI